MGANVLRILIVDEEAEELRETLAVMQAGFPDATVFGVHSMQDLESVLACEETHAMLLCQRGSFTQILEALQRIRVSDSEPVIAVAAPTASPAEVAELYNGGCDKVLVERDSWRGESVPAFRHLLRLKRVEEENKRLLAKLTEANLMLEEKNRRLDDFSATLAHDIRGPLGGVSMKLEYIFDKYESVLDERAKQLITRALQSTDRLTSIVQSMYDLARLGAKAAKMGEVELSAVVNAAIGDLSFDEKLEIKIGVGELPKVWGNPQLLERVFMNLINNAVKYNDKSPVLINIGVRSFHERSIARFAEVFVQDNGPGIPQDELKDIFTMFSRGSTSSNGAEGTGIGLAVVQRIVELHFGEVRVESVVGQGTTFYLMLPLEKIGFVDRTLPSNPSDPSVP